MKVVAFRRAEVIGNMCCSEGSVTPVTVAARSEA